MLIYELEIGFKSNNFLQISVECVDEADAKDTFVGLINDLTMTDSGGYLLEYDKGLATFSVKDVEYITWKQMRDTHKEALSAEAMKNTEHCTFYTAEDFAVGKRE